MSHKLDSKEQEILEGFEAGELEAVPDADAQIVEAHVIAQNTLNKINWANLLAAINEAYDDFPDEEERAVQREISAYYRKQIEDNFFSNE